MEHRERIGEGLTAVIVGAAIGLVGTAFREADEQRSAASAGLVGGMFIYNAGFVALAMAGALGAVGPPQWAAVAVHGTLAIWCAWVVAARRG
jgi:hypothetical protein